MNDYDTKRAASVKARTSYIASLASAIVKLVVEGSKPSGHVYAALMQSGLTLEEYEEALSATKRFGYVVESGARMLTATAKARALRAVA